MRKKQPKLRNALTARHIRIGRLVTRSTACATALLTVAVEVLLAVLAPDNLPLSVLYGLFMCGVFCFGLMGVLWLWEIYGSVSRDGCADVMKRFEARPEFAIHRDQVLAMGRRFVWQDLRMLSSYEVECMEWQQHYEREQRLDADCRRLYGIADEDQAAAEGTA
ncbi:hypothetical protein [Paraburkholderia youngii]|uniref:hypothetical protein n=1 Tax=Paraburkholderia youngii TaxID=2782701 RepID=UPI003D190AC4